MGNPRPTVPLLCGQIYVRPDVAGDDEVIAQVASRQAGHVARRQLVPLGIGKRSIEHRLAAGRLRPRHAGVYTVGHDADSPRAKLAAALLSVGPGAGASHRSAAALCAIEGEHPSIVAVTSTSRRGPRQGVTIHRARLDAEDLTCIDGIPATTPARTLLDLAAIESIGSLRRHVKRAEFEGLVTASELAAVLARHPRKRGRRNLAAIVNEFVIGVGRTRSELEDRFAGFLKRRGLPLPETNVVLRIRGRGIEVDCLWREARLIVELDGRAAHTTNSGFQDDRSRDRALIAAGWSPMRVTWADVHLRPDELEADLRAGLAFPS